MAYYRFLNNERVTLGELRQSLATHCQHHVTDLHVLAVSDTSEINLSAHQGRLNPAELGVLSNDRNVGFFLHPTLVLDAKDGFPLGVSDVHLWSRPMDHEDKHTRNYKALPIEAKESFKWLHGPQYSQRSLAAAARVTYVADREADTYELWERVPDATTQVLVRASRNRTLVNTALPLYDYLAQQPSQGTYAVWVNGDRRKAREAREAWMSVRFVPVTMKRPRRLPEPAAVAEIPLYAVEARELHPPQGQAPVHWRLLTTHPVETLEQALQVIRWYAWRWRIEQLFAVLKQHGLALESTQLESVAAIKRLCVLSLGAALRTLQVHLGRQDETRSADVVFSAVQQRCLAALNGRLCGRTRKQQNPFAPKTLAWASWLIARLGGWSGYRSQRPPGIATYFRGLKDFDRIFGGWSMAHL